MADSELNVILRLVDGVSDGLKNVGNNVKKTGDDLETFGKSLRTVSREAGNLGSVLALWGAAGVAPFALALKNSEQSIAPVQKAMQQMGDVIQAFQESLASSVVPVIQKFTKELNGIYQGFLAIPQPIRDSITQGLLIVSVLTLMTGIFIKVGAEIGKAIADLALLTGKFLDFLGVMVATNPVLLAIGVAVGFLIALMIKYKEVADVVMNTFEILFRSLEAGFQLVASIVLESLSKIYDALGKFYDFMAKNSPIARNAFNNMADGAHNLSKTLDNMATSSFQGVFTQSQKMSQIITTGTGEWARGFDYAKTHIADFFKSFTTGSNTFVLSHKTIQTAMQATEGAFQTLGTALQGAAAQNKAFAVANQVVQIGLAIGNTAVGITNALAIPPPWVGIALASVIGAAGAIQIATIAAQSFAVGTPSVPSDMMAQVHKGETIIPATFADAIRKGDLSLSGKGQSGGGDVHVNVYYPKMGTLAEVKAMAQALGTEIERQLRYVGAT